MAEGIGKAGPGMNFEHQLRQVDARQTGVDRHPEDIQGAFETTTSQGIRRAVFLPDPFFLFSRHRTDSISTSVTTANIQKQASFAACNNGREFASLGLVTIAMCASVRLPIRRNKAFQLLWEPEGGQLRLRDNHWASSVPH